MTPIKNIYQQVSEIEDVKYAFNLIVAGFSEDYNMQYKNFTAYGMVGETVLEFVKETSKGFQSDIASKALKYGNPSEKQAWCVAFEFIKIKSQYVNWMEKQIAA